MPWLVLVQALIPLAIKLVDKFVPTMITKKRPNNMKRKILEKLESKRRKHVNPD